MRVRHKSRMLYESIDVKYPEQEMENQEVD
jgi:hypothetical protein